MMRAPRCTGLLAATTLAVSGVSLSAKTTTQAPNVFESGYYYLALQLSAPELCDRISAEAVEHGPLFGRADMRIRYLQSKCYYDLAVQRQDLVLCQRVRTISTFLRNGSGLSSATCLERVAQGQTHTGGDYGTGMLLGVMGYGDDDIRKEYPEHPAPDRSADFLQRLSWRNGVEDDLRSRLDRLPDFSRGDAAAIQHLNRAVPQCADRRARSFECRRLRCGLVRAQDGDRRCEHRLERERAPWQ